MYNEKNLTALTNTGHASGSLYYYFNASKDDVSENHYFKDVRLSIGDVIIVYDGTQVLKYKVTGSSANNKSVELLDEYSERKVIELEDDSGTLTEEQINIVKNNHNNVVIINGGQVYSLSNTNDELTYKTFLNMDVGVSEYLVSSAIYIQLNKEAVNYGQWTKETIDVVDVLKSVSGYDSAKVQTLKNNNGEFVWVDDTP